MSAYVQFADTAKSFGPVEVVRKTNLGLERNSLVVFLGPSGCGKTTLMRMVGGLDEPTNGSILLGGEKVVRPDRRRGMVFQSYSSFPWLTVEDNIAFGMRYRNDITSAQKSERTRHYLDLFGLADFAASYPNRISGGMRQRVGIARALALSPKFVLADEIVSGLDVSTQAQILTLLEKLAAEMGLTVAFISHDLSVIRRLCQQVIVMREGRIVEASATDALFDNPKEAYTRDLLAAIPLPEIDPDWLLPKVPA